MFEDVIKLETDIYGLKYRPSLEPEISDDADTVAELMKTKMIVLSELRKVYGKSIKAVYLDGEEFPIEGLGFPIPDRMLLSEKLLELGDNCGSILEVGVANRGYSLSSAKIFYKNKPSGSTYIGVDIADKSEIDNSDKGMYTIKTDSSDIKKVMKFAKSLRVTEFDFIFIDGLHSVNQVVDDWRFVKYLSKKGVCLLHDTTLHPGPYTLFDAIDEELFNKEKFFVDEPNSYGMSVITRKQ